MSDAVDGSHLDREEARSRVVKRRNPVNGLVACVAISDFWSGGVLGGCRAGAVRELRRLR